MGIHDPESEETFFRELLGWLAASLAAHRSLASGDDREAQLGQFDGE